SSPDGSCIVAFVKNTKQKTLSSKPGSSLYASNNETAHGSETLANNSIAIQRENTGSVNDESSTTAKPLEANHGEDFENTNESTNFISSKSQKTSEIIINVKAYVYICSEFGNPAS